ncbi:uncharacterized protein LOC110828452 [Zootermopsis nevadensis]|uniref:uncharacterized protein LOC110828452 n=1 Tax=Zootermopsis nevadensis TaxID=136037 RepID=UPI000B8E78A8|nr:uncharacterized protein LOC110828452 [Zootermopsis nevadensis]
MENNFTVDANSTEVAKTLVPLLQIGIAIVAIFAFLLLLIISAFIASIYELYQTSHESPDNTTLITISAVSNTEITDNSTPKITAPTDLTCAKQLPLEILKFIQMILYTLLGIYLGLLVIYSDRKRATYESPDNTTFITISAFTNTEITNNSTTNSTSPTDFTRAQTLLRLYVLLGSFMIVTTLIMIYKVSLELYKERKETTRESEHNSTLITKSAINSTTNSTSPTLFT